MSSIISEEKNDPNQIHHIESPKINLKNNNISKNKLVKKSKSEKYYKMCVVNGIEKYNNNIK